LSNLININYLTSQIHIVSINYFARESAEQNGYGFFLFSRAQRRSAIRYREPNDGHDDGQKRRKILSVLYCTTMLIVRNSECRGPGERKIIENANSIRLGRKA